MTFGLSINTPSFSRLLDCTNGPGRHNLFAAAGQNVRILVRNRLARESARRHFTAARLHATPSGHLERAARNTTFSADNNSATVTIAAPGISRAFHNVTIRPKKSRYLTIPLYSIAYAKRVQEMKSLGWKIFRVGKVLKGYRNQGDEVVSLYALKEIVKQRQDRSLLPSDSEITAAANNAINLELQRVKAS